MGIRTYIKKLLEDKDRIEVTPDMFDKYIDSSEMAELCTMEFFILVAESLIANIISKCQFRTCMYGKEVKGDEYYLWNYEPNKNQSGGEFKKAIISKLLQKNECLIVSVRSGLYVADSYIIYDESLLRERRFCDVTIGSDLLPGEYRMSDVIFIRLNNTNIRNLVRSVSEGYKRIAKNALEDYEKAGGRKGTLRIDTMAMNKKYGEKTFQEVYDDLIRVRFSKYFKEKNAVLPLFNGFEYSEQETGKRNAGDNKANDYKSMMNEIASKVGLAYNIPPKFMTGEVEGMRDATDLLLSVCIDPMGSGIATSINRSRYKKNVLKGCYLWVDTSTILHIDLFAVAEKIDKLIASGMCSIDELRSRAMLLELGTEESTKHWITKNYQEITTKEGGE